jgi:hypothetical protein
MYPKNAIGRKSEDLQRTQKEFDSFMHGMMKVLFSSTERYKEKIVTKVPLILIKHYGNI